MSFMNGFGIQPAEIPSWFYLHEPTLLKNQISPYTESPYGSS